jgi:hypothetical protein
VVSIHSTSTEWQEVGTVPHKALNLPNDKRMAKLLNSYLTDNFVRIVVEVNKRKFLSFLLKNVIKK